MNQLLRFKKDQMYVGFDVETCHLNLLKDNLPWQIGYYIAKGDKLEKVVNKYIKWPNLNVSADAARITGFNRFEYETNAEDATEVLNGFSQYLEDPNYIVIFHNGFNFDAYVYNIWRQELGLKKDFSYFNRCIDTNSLARLVKMGSKSIDRDNWYPEFCKMSNFVKKGVKTSLSTLHKEFDIDMSDISGGLHDASYDIVLMQRAFNKLINLIEI